MPSRWRVVKYAAISRNGNKEGQRAGRTVFLQALPDAHGSPRRGRFIYFDIYLRISIDCSMIFLVKIATLKQMISMNGTVPSIPLFSFIWRILEISRH